MIHRKIATMIKLFLLLIFSPYAAVSQVLDCGNVHHEGKFELVNSDIDDIIIRTKRKQVELINGGTSMVISKVKWLSSDTYSLKLKKLINCPASTTLRKNSTIEVQITGCTSESYSCVFRYEGLGEIVAEYVKVDE
jgi:hypothetical protein